MTERRLKIDAEHAATFADAAGEIATQALNGLSEAARRNLAEQMPHGSLYLHVQLHPAFIVVLAFAPNDSESPRSKLRVGLASRRMRSSGS